MKKIAAVLALGLLSGCVSANQQAAEFNAALAEDGALAREHKISYTEGATRDSAAAERIYGAQMSDRDHIYYAYCVALATQVDAGKVTPQEAKALLDLRTAEYHAEYNAELRAANSAALNAIGNSLQQTADQTRPQRPINCNSVPSGSTVNTTCY